MSNGAYHCERYTLVLQYKGPEETVETEGWLTEFTDRTGHPDPGSAQTLPCGE